MTHKRMLGGILLPLNSIIMRGDDPLDLSAYTVKFQMEVEEKASGGTTIARSGIATSTRRPTRSNRAPTASAARASTAIAAA